MLDDRKLMVLTIRNFPRDLHREAKIRAAVEGISLKDLFIKALSEYLERRSEHGNL